MSLTHRVLRLGNIAISSVFVLVALVSVWMWIRAFLNWGVPVLLADAMFWSLLALVGFGAVLIIEYVQPEGA